ncbi:MAG TPA: hypothetical protein GX512_03795 [Firmicutes bacterium]|nr:hypothetical protein [Candidatus Fermentithermobacillaceae bacterium]
MPKLLQEYRDFGGGLCVDLSPDMTPDNCLTVAENVDLSARAIRKRAGSVKLNSASYNGEINRIIEWPRNDGSTVWLAVKTVGSTVTLNKVDKATGALTQICTLNKADIGWFFWQDRFYFGDGAQYRYYDGAVVKMGYPLPPTSAPTVQAISGNPPISPPGTRLCAVSFVYEDGTESVIGPSASVNTGGGHVIEWSNIPTGAAGSGVVARKLYVTHAGTTSPFYFAEILNNNTSTIAVTSGDDSTRTVPSSSRDISAVSRCNRFVVHPHSQRIFASGDPQDKAAIYYSDTGPPYEFRKEWKRYPPTGHSEVVALSVFGDAVVVHYAGGHMRWKGVDPATDVTWYQMPVNVGLVSPFAVSLVPNALFFLGQGGPYIVSPAALETDYILQPGDSIVRNIAEDRYASLITRAADLSQAVAVYDHLRERLLLAFKQDPSSTGNDSVLCIEWDTQAASIWKGIKANHFCLCRDGTLLVASTNYILKLNQPVFTDVDTATGNAVPVSMTARTKAWDFGYGRLRKKVFDLFFTTEAVQGGTLDLSVLGGEEDIVKTGLSVPEGKTYQTRVSAKGERFAVEVANSKAQDVRLNSLALEFKVRKAKGEEV